MLRRICELVSKENWKKLLRARPQIFERPTNSVTGDRIRHLLKEISPALVVLLFTFLFSEFFSGLSSIKGWELIFRISFRFFRFTLLLCLPLYALSPIYSFVVKRIRGRLLQIERIQEMCIHPLKHWVFRPFEGIGIGLLFETKLLATLQIITGVTAKPFLLFPRNQYDSLPSFHGLHNLPCPFHQEQGRISFPNIGTQNRRRLAWREIDPYNRNP